MKGMIAYKEEGLWITSQLLIQVGGAVCFICGSFIHPIIARCKMQDARCKMQEM